MKKLLAVALLSSVLATGAFAGKSLDKGPQGFATTPTVVSVAQAKEADDDARVTLRGKLTEHLRKDKYTFVDEKGDSVMVELDDDRDWSHISRGQLIEIQAKVDRGWNDFKLEVKKATPLEAAPAAAK